LKADRVAGLSINSDFFKSAVSPEAESEPSSTPGTFAGVGTLDGVEHALAPPTTSGVLESRPFVCFFFLLTAPLFALELRLTGVDFLTADVDEGATEVDSAFLGFSGFPCLEPRRA